MSARALARLLGAARPGARLPVAVLAVLAVVTLGACTEPPPPAPEAIEDELPPQIFEEEEPPAEPPPPAVAEGVFGVAAAPRRRAPPPIRPASHGDGEYATDEPVVARRYVYRARMIVPAGLGSESATLTVPAAELVIDVSHERLRARFAGDGWPLHRGAEVRLRRDRPGVYLFDGDGGRPLEPGQLARWFEGGPVTRRGPPLRIFSNYGFSRRQPIPDDEVTPGELVCAFLAEWAGDDRDGQIRRCERGAPNLWRLGFWLAEQTAGVPIELTRRQLRADEREPPRLPRATRSGAFLEPEALGRLEPAPLSGEPVPDAPTEGLRVSNESANRVVLSLEGIALGWVDRGQVGHFTGLTPGMYDVGSIRPLGAVVQRGRPVRVPGVHRVCDGRCPRPAPSEE